MSMMMRVHEMKANFSGVLSVWALVACLSVRGADPLVRFDFEETQGACSEDVAASRVAYLSPEAKWASGSFGGALVTGSQRACANLGSFSELDGADACTIFLRFRREGEASGPHPCLLSCAKWGDGGVLFYNKDNKLTVRLRAGSKGPESGWCAFERIPEKKWCSVALVFKRPEALVYANGRLVLKAKWDHPFQSGGDWRLGAWSSDSFGGFIDDFRVWKAPLDAAAIAELADDSRYAEIEGYQDDGTGGVKKTEILGQGGRPFVSFADKAATLVFDTIGNIVSLKENATGRELVQDPVPFVTATRTNGGVWTAGKLLKRGADRLAWRFPSRMGEVEMRVEPFDGGWKFMVTASTLKDVRVFSFGGVKPACTRWRGTFVNAFSDEKSAVCVRSGDLFGSPRTEKDRLCVDVTAPDAVVGRSALLAAGPRDGFREQLAAMTVAAGAPTSDAGGARSIGSEVSRWSYVFAPVVNGDIDYWIDFVKRAGFQNIHINSSWTDCLGHNPVNKRAFPGGLEEMKACAAKVHAAGLKCGMHSLTACINPRDPWISPVCREELVADATYTLAAPLDEKSTELLVNEEPVKRHSPVFTYSSNGNVFRYKNELIQYTGIDRSRRPYAFTGLKRGAFGTKKGGTIPAGAKIDYLHQRYIAFYPQPDSKLADELADGLANVYNTCNLDEFYFDGSEGMGTRYGVDVMRHKIYRRLRANNGHSPSIEASCQNANNWWFQTRTATTDHGVYGVRRFHDWHLNWAIENGRLANFLEPQMGWWQPRVDVPLARGHMLDEMEYFAGKNAGHDAAMSIQGVAMRPVPIGVRRQLTVLGWYEYPRLARAFTPEAQNYLAGDRTEARLRQNAAGTWDLTDVEWFVHRAGFAADRTWSWNGGRTARPAALRVEALYRADAATNGCPLLKAADFAAMTSQGAAGVSCTFTPDVTGEHGAAFRLTAVNNAAERQPTACWAVARRKFDFPGLDCGRDRTTFGAWVKGDGSGALLNLQLTTPGEYNGGISEHYLRLDFTGWRYVTMLIRERDAYDYGKYQWPYGGGYAAIYRNFVKPEHVATFAAYLNDIPKGRETSVEIGEVTMFPMAADSFENAVVAIGGETFPVPFKLTSGEYAELDGGAWTHFSAQGTALARVPAAKTPILAAGANACTFTAPEGVRAEVTAFAFGRKRPALAQALTPEMKAKMRYEGVMPFEFAPEKGLVAPKTIAVRPGEKARLTLEVYGPAENPTFAFPDLGVTCLLAAKIGAEERLVCRDGRAWCVENARTGALVRQGALETALPVLTASTAFAFTATRPADAVCQVDILKEYGGGEQAKAAAAPPRRALFVGVSDQCPKEENGRNVRVRANYCAALAKAGHIPVVVPRFLTDAEMEALLAKLDLLVMTGGEDFAPARYGEKPSPQLGEVNLDRDTFDYRLMDAATRRRLPIVGICRGCQLINIYFGGTLVQDIPSEWQAVQPLQHRGTLHPLELTPDSRFAQLIGATHAEVNSAHHQAVKAVAKGFAVTGKAPDGIVEVIEGRDYPALGLQFHPEALAIDRGRDQFLRFFQELGGWIEAVRR